MLERINTHEDLVKLNKEELLKLAQDIREFLLNNLSKTGGHLSSNLGTVELTIALNYIFDFKKDAIVWDVGHQAYVHKILTNRKHLFTTLREYKGLCGFPSVEESEYDHFSTGHASTAISAALGMAKAFELQNKKNYSIAVLGDGALSGGLAYEALNNAGDLNRPFLIILNDNEMSISDNVGGMNNYLSLIRSSVGYTNFKNVTKKNLHYIPLLGKLLSKTLSWGKKEIKNMFIESESGNFFESLGLKYIGPIDGHNLNLLIDVIKNIKDYPKPILLHIITKKGKGYDVAEKDPIKYHGVEAFDVESGIFNKKSNSISFTKAFGDKMIEMAHKYPNLVAITAAMSTGTGLEEFKKQFPDRFFDVGIAEAHAVTFAAGLASKGIKPVVAIYSTFLQRALDQVIHDVCLDKHPVIFALDRAGIVGKDGKTHQGIFDISFLSFIPNLEIIAVSDKKELELAFEYAYHCNNPVAIRYPRANVPDEQYPTYEYQKGKGVVLKENGRACLISCGALLDVAKKLALDLDLKLIDARFIKPLDKEFYLNHTKGYEHIFVLEENVETGGFNNLISKVLKRQVHSLSLPNQYIEHGDQNTLKKALNFNYDGLYNRISALINKK